MRSFGAYILSKGKQWSNMVQANAFSRAKRVVVKIGTSTLTYETGQVNLRRMERLVKVLSELKNSGKDAEELDLSPAGFASLITMVQKGSINRTVGKKVLAAMFSDKVDPEQYVRENGLEAVNDDAAIRKAVEEVLAQNEKSVTEYKSGKEKALQFLMGQSMRALRGKANPQTITAILHELLD